MLSWPPLQHRLAASQFAVRNPELDFETTYGWTRTSLPIQRRAELSTVNGSEPSERQSIEIDVPERLGTMEWRGR
jgi:hypothetical protein